MLTRTGLATSFSLFFTLSLFGQSKFLVDDKNLYASDFLTTMEDPDNPLWSYSRTAELNAGFLILDGNDTVEFSHNPAIGKTIIMTAKKDELAVALTVERTNLTSIKFKLEMVEFGNTNHFKEGIASISPHFYLGSESDEIDGAGYLVDEYLYREGDCYCNIRIGETFQTGELLASIVSNCNGSLQELNLENFPKLRMK